MFRRLSPTEMLFKASATSKRKENSPRARSPFDPPLLTASQPQVPRIQVSEFWPNSLSPNARDDPVPMTKATETGSTGLSKEVFLGGQDRLTRVQVLFTRKPTPRQSSVFTDRIIATTTKICTRSTIRNSQAHAKRFGSYPAPSYAALAFYYQKAGVPSVIRLSIVHFRGWCIRQVSCYTLLSRFQLPWPRPCCLDEPTPFMGSN